MSKERFFYPHNVKTGIGGYVMIQGVYMQCKIYNYGKEKAFPYVSSLGINTRVRKFDEFSREEQLKLLTTIDPSMHSLFSLKESVSEV